MRLTAILASVALAGLLLLVASVQPASAQGNGTISGHLTNGTAGAPAPADVEVVVHILQNRVKTGEQRVRTNAAGDFQVTGLATGPDLLYFPIVQYAGVAHFPEQPVVLSGPDPAQVTITVYESTPKPDALSFERLNMLVMGVSPTALTVMEMGAVVNGGDRTFAADPQVTGSARTLRFNLPPGAIDVTPQAGLPDDSLESTPDGFASTDPVRPGRREIAFSYQLPYASPTIDLTRTFAFPVGAFTLYVPNDVGVVMAGGNANPSLVDLGGRQFRPYGVGQVAPGAEVRFRLTGLPAPLFARPRDLGVAVVIGASTILLVCLVMALSRGSSPAPATPEAAASFDPSVPLAVASERLALVRAVALLDDRFAAGGLDEETYRAERAQQKARLVAMTRLPAPQP